MADGTISSNAFVGDGVTLGLDVSIGPGAVVRGPTVIGDRVWIGPGAVIGGPPERTGHEQNSAWTGQLRHQGVEIGDDVIIREHVVIHQGSERATRVGNSSWLLNSSYLAHDVVLGSEVTVSAGVKIGGHATIGDRCNLGMNALVHQRRVVAAGAMVGMGTPVTRDVPPFAKVFGTPPRLIGLNVVAMERLGLDATVIEALRLAYQSGDLLLDDATDLAALVEYTASWRALTGRIPVKSALVGRSAS